jgi:hypothetical protein
MIKLLVEHGADINELSDFRKTSLHVSVELAGSRL